MGPDTDPGMNTISASAESAREAARDADGKFGAHAAGESAATLSTAEHTYPGSTAPELSDEETEHLEDETSDRWSFHDNEEQYAYEEIGHCLRGCNEDGSFDTADDLTYYREVAAEHNMHVASRIAYEAPTQATVAEIYIDTDQVGAYYDRDGAVIEHLPDRGDADFHADPTNGISQIPAYAQYTGPGFSAVEDSAFVDLEAARRGSDEHMKFRLDDGGDVPHPRSAETEALQLKASLRSVGDGDTLSDGDYVYSPARRWQPEISGYASGTAFDAGINGVQVFNEDGSGLTSVEDLVIYTARQRPLQR